MNAERNVIIVKVSHNNRPANTLYWVLLSNDTHVVVSIVSEKPRHCCRTLLHSNTDGRAVKELSQRASTNTKVKCKGLYLVSLCAVK